MKNLHKNQLNAVTHGEGPLLIIAGAGTGKTTVITERILHLVSKAHALPSQILALTFTQKAADEMQERVDIALPYGYSEMWISTFHSFCDHVLREEALEIGLTTGYSLLSTAESVQLIRSNLFSLGLSYYRPLGNPNKFIFGLLTHFSRLQDEDIAPDEYIDWVEKQKNKKIYQDQAGVLEYQKLVELSKAYKIYDDIKTREGYLDFGDLIGKTVLLFRKRPNILKSYQKKYPYILIDEFQDTNYSQNQLAMLLAGKNGNITVVGDDDQSIYRFRGAAVSNIIHFKKKYPKAKTVVLTKNYRSTKQILDASYRLIQHNNPDRLEVTEHVNKKLSAAREEEGDISFIHTQRAEEEAAEVVTQIEHLVAKENYAWGDIAILVRANSHADSFVRGLTHRGIPYQFLGPDKLFARPEIIELTSYLKALVDQDDEQALYHLFSMKEVGIPHQVLTKMMAVSKKDHTPLIEVLRDYKSFTKEDEVQERFEKLFELIDVHTGEIKTKSPGKILYEFIQGMDMITGFINPKGEDDQVRGSNIVLFFEKLRGYEATRSDASLYEVIDWVELSEELGDSPRAAEVDWGARDAVTIMTIHGAKGLEFPVVFLVNLVGERFPSRNRRDQIPIPEGIIKETLPEGDFHVQEERRLFYVGMTRARDKLFFSASDYYGDAKRKKKISPFIFESLGDSITEAETEAPKQISLLSFEPDNKKAPMKETHHVHYLSYSQISTFKMCPLHYKLKYILNIPTPPSPALSIGSSVHNALRDYYRSSEKGSKLVLPLLLKKLEENWINEGFESREHKEEAMQSARNMLANYYQKYFKKDTSPLAIEQPFTVPLIRKDEKSLKIGGVIDRVDPKGKGIEIIDYKTGTNVPSQKEADNNLQLGMYALAAMKIKEPPFDLDPEDITLTLIYLEADEVIHTKRSKEELIASTDEIFAVREEIENSDFSCSNHPFCTTCEYKSFCRQESS